MGIKAFRIEYERARRAPGSSSQPPIGGASRTVEFLKEFPNLPAARAWLATQSINEKAGVVLMYAPSDLLDSPGTRAALKRGRLLPKASQTKPIEGKRTKRAAGGERGMVPGRAPRSSGVEFVPFKGTVTSRARARRVTAAGGAS